MSSPESSGGSSPAPLKFTDTDEREDTRLGAGVVALIIAAIVIIAAGVTAAVVLSNQPAPVEPPTPTPGGEFVQPAAAPASGLRDRELPVALMSTGSPMATGVAYLAVGQQVDLNEDVSIAVADGWEVIDQQEGAVAVVNSDGVVLTAQVGQSDSGDPEEVLANVMASVADPDGGLANLKVSKVAVDKVNGKNFQQFAKQEFMGDLTTQQGTKTLVGNLIVFMNTSTQMSAVVMVLAPGPEWDTFDAAVDDLNPMIGSMV